MTPDHEATARDIVESWLDAQSVGLIETLVDDIGSLITAIAEALSRAASEATCEGATIGYMAAEKRALVKVREIISGTAGDPNRSEYHRGWHGCVTMALAVLDRYIAAGGKEERS